MSRKKRTIEKQKKQNSPAKKAKQAKKQFYASPAAEEQWKEKKFRKKQSQLNRRQSQGVSMNCPLESWEQPSIEKCEGCDLECSQNSN